MGKDTKEDFSAEEAQRRFEQALKGALKTPPKPHKAKEKQQKPSKLLPPKTRK